MDELEKFSTKILSKKAGLIFLLILFFVIDDILVFALLRNIYDWNISSFTFLAGAVFVLLLNFGLALAVLKIMRKQPTTGQQGMVGKKGIVLEHTNSEYVIRVHGEIWKSQSTEKLSVGDKVIVNNVNGLTLEVHKLMPVIGEKN